MSKYKHSMQKAQLMYDYRRTNMDKKTFSKRLKELREERKINKTELAGIIGCDQPKISKLENPDDKTMPTIDNLIMLSEYFHVSTDYLLGCDASHHTNSITLADVVQRLFDIETATNISITKHSEERYEDSHSNYDYYPNLVSKDMFKLAFEEHGFDGYYLNDFMKEWKEVRDFLNGKDDKISTQIYELWKKDQLVKAAEHYRLNIDIDEALPFD